MKRIGTTATGGILLEATPEELATVDAAIVTLQEWRALCEVQELAPTTLPARPAPLRQPAKAAKPARPPAATSGKTCSICQQTKPADDFYAVGRQCKQCLRAKSQAKYRAKAGEAKPKKPKGMSADQAFQPKDHRLSGRVGKGGPRERDPALDRPTDGNGRVLPVGPQD